VLTVAALLALPATALTAFPGDNGRIAFDSLRDGPDVDIWTINPDGSDPLNLTADSAVDDFAAEWSPGSGSCSCATRTRPGTRTPPRSG
jgi:hypothetical protein